MTGYLAPSVPPCYSIAMALPDQLKGSAVARHTVLVAALVIVGPNLLGLSPLAAASELQWQTPTPAQLFRFCRGLPHFAGGALEARVLGALLGLGQPRLKLADAPQELTITRAKLLDIRTRSLYNVARAARTVEPGRLEVPNYSLANQRVRAEWLALLGDLLDLHGWNMVKARLAAGDTVLTAKACETYLYRLSVEEPLAAAVFCRRLGLGHDQAAGRQQAREPLQLSKTRGEKLESAAKGYLVQAWRSLVDQDRRTASAIVNLKDDEFHTARLAQASSATWRLGLLRAVQQLAILQRAKERKVPLPAGADTHPDGVVGPEKLLGSMLVPLDLD